MLAGLLTAVSDVLLVSTQDRPISPVQLPADEFGHEVPVEWWYFVCHLKTKGGADRFALEMTALRLRPRALRPIYTCYLAVIDLQRRRYLSADRQNDSAYDHEVDRFRLRFGPPMGQPGAWLIEGTAITGAPVRYQLEGTFQAEREQIGCRLTLEDRAGKPVLLHGPNGVFTLFGLELGYYSRTRLAVDGALTFGGRHVIVDGDGWVDHEYGAADLPNNRWTFLAIQLDSGEELCVYRVARRAAPESGMIHAYLVDKRGNAYAATAAELQPYGPLWGPWGYPLRHRIAARFEGREFRLRVEPEFEEQRRVPTGKMALPYVTFWEGAAKVLDDRSGTSIGHAFVELAGYE